MVYVKSFDILGIATAQIPCIELHGAPNSATVGAVGLLGMDVDSEGHEVYKCTAVNGAIYTWESLKDGKDGTCVVKAEVDYEDKLILTLSDGTTLNAGVVRGPKGEDGVDGVDGMDGVSVANTQITNGELIITLSNGTVKNLGKVVGENGQDGTSVVSAEVTDGLELVIRLSNGTIMNLGSIKADHAAIADYAETVNPSQIPLHANVHYSYDGFIAWYKEKYGTYFNWIPYRDSSGEMVYPLVPCEHGVASFHLSRVANKGDEFSMIASCSNGNGVDVFQLICEINEQGIAADGKSKTYSFYVKDYTLLHNGATDATVVNWENGSAAVPKATQDENGKNIASTYATKASLTTLTTQIQNGTIVANKADVATTATQDGNGNNIADTYAKKQALTSGSIVVKSATQDGNGNNIADTYATQNNLSTSLNGLKTQLTDGTITVKSATKATQDGNGNNIASTYVTQSGLNTAVSNIQNGTTIVGEATKATQDEYGDNIADTYATKTSLNTLQSKITNGLISVGSASKLSNMSSGEGTVTGTVAQYTIRSPGIYLVNVGVKNNSILSYLPGIICIPNLSVVANGMGYSGTLKYTTDNRILSYTASGSATVESMKVYHIADC